MTMNRPDHPAYVVVLASGGLDSTTLAYRLRDMGAKTRLLSFDYGQRHSRELECARQVADGLGVPHDVADLRSVGGLLRGSALTDPLVPVPDGHYAAESMRTTVVPNRNAVMLDIAVAVAIANGCDAVAFGAHGGDHAVYPDCRPEFVTAFTASAMLANQGFLPGGFQIVAPFLDCDKAEIVRLGSQLGVPFAATWSCYKGGTVHCGTCGTCTERREAFLLAGVADPTPYAGWPAVYTIGKRFTFEASHVLSGLPEGHRCARLHGHGYTVEVEVAAGALTGPGWVTDFGDLAPFGRYLDEHFDHRHLNDVLEDQPTSENLAAHFFGWCAEHLGPVIGGRVTAVRVSEKREATWAEYRPDSP